jgi:hypothetical protein
MMKEMRFWILLFGLLLNVFQVSAGVTLAQNEYNYLYELYNSTGGEYWIYPEPYSVNGYPWNFSNSSTNNPCRNHWSGLYCTCVDQSPNAVCNLFDIGVTNMNLTGTIPPVVSDFPKLLFFDISSNFIQGNLSVFNNTPWIEYANFSYNLFTGTIPENFLDPENVEFIELIYFSNNFITGTVPSVFWELSRTLQYFNVFNNSLTGTLPKEVGLLNNSVYLNFGDNKFHGTIPASLNNITTIKQLFLCNNQFTSSIPINITGLEVLWTDHNYLSGTIPSNFCNMVNISVIAIDHNQLDGTVPPCLSSLTELSVFQVQNNNLGGSIANAFNSAIQTSLTVIDISDNSITGTFPAEIFALRSLNSLASVKNCFIGSLSSDICNDLTTSLETISLDGLHSSTTCVVSYWDLLYPTEAGTTGPMMVGTIPDCLYSLPHLNTLHLSGNGFSGTIPDVNASSLSKNLQDFSLSHNRLKGTIPNWIQNYPFFLNVDFSYNKITGNINNFTAMSYDYSADDYSTIHPNAQGATLDLENNRISGKVSSALHTVENIQILLGNVFECSNNLPENDPNESNYICGASEFDAASLVFAIYLSVLAVLLLLGVWLYFKIQKYQVFFEKCYFCYRFLLDYLAVVKGIILKSYEDPFSLAEEQILLSRYINLYQFFYSLSLIRKMSQHITVYTFVVCLPIYLGFYVFGGSDYNKYTHKYTWITTSAFLTGNAVAILLLFIWFFLFVYVLTLIFIHYNIYQQETTPLEQFFENLKSYFRNFWEGMKRRNVSKSTSMSEPPGRSVPSVSNHTVTSLRASLLQAHSQQDRTALMNLDPVHNNNISTPVYSNHNSFYERKKNHPTYHNNSLSERISERGRNSETMMRTSDIDIIQKQEGEVDLNMEETKERKEENQLNELPNLQALNGEEEDVEAGGEIENKRSSLFLSFISNNKDSNANNTQNKNNDEKKGKSGRNSTLAILNIDHITELIQDEEVKNRFKYYCLYLLVMFINFLVGITVNAGYLVLENSHSITSQAKVMVQVFMALFKLIWNIVVIRRMVSWLQPFEKSVTRLHVGMLIFNSIIAPGMATALTDSSCFQEVFVDTETITSSYSLTTCIESYEVVSGVVSSTICTHYDTVTYETEFTPNFIYYYTCGTKLLTLYTPVFIYTYTILFITSGIVYSLFMVLPTSYFPQWLLTRIDGIIRPNDRGNVIFERLIRAHSIEALLTQHIIVLLTFGINSPILAMIMMITISFECYVWQFFALRYIKYDCKSCPFSPVYALPTTSEPPPSLLSVSESSAASSSLTTTDNPLFLQKLKEQNENAMKIDLEKGVNQDDDDSDSDSDNEGKGEGSRGEESFQSSQTHSRFSSMEIDSSSVSSQRKKNKTTNKQDGHKGVSSQSTDSLRRANGLGGDLAERDSKKLSLSSKNPIFVLLSDLNPHGDPSQSVSSFSRIASANPSVGNEKREAAKNNNMISTGGVNDTSIALPSPFDETEGGDAEDLSTIPSLVSIQQIFELTKTEQIRLNELNKLIDDAWLCMYNARWLMFYVVMLFNGCLLIDFSGDEIGWQRAMWVPGVILFLVIVTRLFFLDLMIYFYYEVYLVYWGVTSSTGNNNRGEKEEEMHSSGSQAEERSQSSSSSRAKKIKANGKKDNRKDLKTFAHNYNLSGEQL